MSKMKNVLSVRSVSLSVVALLLVVGFTAGISVLDRESYYDRVNPVDFDEKTLFTGYRSSYTNTNGNTAYTSWQGMGGSEMFFPSDTGGSFMIATGWDALTTRQIELRMNNEIGDSIIAQGDIIKVTIVTDPRVTGVEYRTFLNGVQKFHYFTQISLGVWERNFTAVERLSFMTSITNPEYLIMRYYSGSTYQFPPNGIVEFAISFDRADTPIYYATTIAGILGVVLLTMAVFISPYVSTQKVRNIHNSVGRNMSAWCQNRKNRKRNKQKMKREGKI